MYESVYLKMIYSGVHTENKLTILKHEAFYAIYIIYFICV